MNQSSPRIVTLKQLMYMKSRLQWSVRRSREPRATDICETAVIVTGVARDTAIGQSPTNSKSIAVCFFEMMPIAQCRKILICMHV